jgi:chromosomal replication initiator protein
LLAPNRFVLQWVKERFVPRIEAMGAEFFSSPIRVSLNLETAEAPELVKTSAPAFRAARAVTPRSPHAERSSLIPEFSFDGFVAGKANQLARAAALQVAEHPGTSYNPLFIYGGVGLGKTHLIHAVGNLVLAQHPSARVRYLHAAQYISDVIRAYQQKSFDEFKRYYHSLDVFHRERPHARGILLRVQCSDRSPQAAHHYLRYLSQGSCRNGRAPQVALFVGLDRGNRAP